jgi:hypothetical protein
MVSAAVAIIRRPGLGFPGKCDLGDVRMSGHLLADPGAGSRNDVEHSRREAGFESQFSETDGAERCKTRGLEDDRISTGERGPDFPGRDYHRKVPRNDQPDHAEWLT